MKVYIPDLYCYYSKDFIFETTATRLTSHLDCIQANGIRSNRKRVFHKDEWFESREDAVLAAILDLQRTKECHLRSIERANQEILKIDEKLESLGVKNENLVS